ncbi:hypothetical protein NT6N_15030 [Oceaniferula spumae]|uniref:Uncharacterized protein n=1 Tax=Oceaniferula spumae TaxID=2979115 RepID=A0AAT9FKJ0_9BACT
MKKTQTKPIAKQEPLLDWANKKSVENVSVNISVQNEESVKAIVRSSSVRTVFVENIIFIRKEA